MLVGVGGFFLSSVKRVLLFPTWTTVFDGYEGCKVLGVVAEHYRVFVALCGRPV